MIQQLTTVIHFGELTWHSSWYLDDMRTRPGTTITTALIGAAVAILTLAGCTAGNNTPSATSPSEELAAYGFENMNASEIIDQLEATPVAERSAEFIASVRPDTLTFSDAEGREVALDIPKDEFYISVAPYIDQTHDCYFHSLTTCLGEMRGEDVTVRVVDNSGTVLLDQETRTADNGFVGLWLPRDINAALTIEHDGRTTTTPISTGDDDPTCLTTAKLS